MSRRRTTIDLQHLPACPEANLRPRAKSEPNLAPECQRGILWEPFHTRPDVDPYHGH